MPDSYAVVGIRAEAGAATRFVLKAPSLKREVVTTWSEVVHSALVAAYIVGADVEVEMDEDPSDAVHRVQAFEARSEPRRCIGHSRVARIATQRVNGVDHLEVFLAGLDDDREKAYNVYAPFLQQLLAAVFQYRETPTCRLGLDATTHEGTIVAVRIGDVV
jgi:hypothetical protein